MYSPSNTLITSIPRRRSNPRSTSVLKGSLSVTPNVMLPTPWLARYFSSIVKIIVCCSLLGRQINPLTIDQEQPESTNAICSTPSMCTFITRSTSFSLWGERTVLTFHPWPHSPDTLMRYSRSLGTSKTVSQIFNYWEIFLQETC